MMRHPILFYLLILALLGSACKSSPPPVPEPLSNGPNTGFLFKDRVVGKVDQIYVDACTEMIKGDYPQAISGFQEVLDIDPGYHAARFNIAKMSLSLRKYEDAINYGKQALAADQTNYWYYKILKDAYQAAGNYTQAINTQVSLTKKFPGKTEEQLELVDLYQKNNQLKQALEILEDLEKADKGSKETGLKQLTILNALKDHKDGLDLVNRLLIKYPEDISLIEEKYNILRALGREDEGIQLLETLFESQPENGAIAMKLAMYYKEKGAPEKADPYLYKAFESPSVDPQEKLSLISSLLEDPDKEAAAIARTKKLATLFREAHPGSGNADLLQARIFSLENKLDSARQKYLSGLKTTSTDIGVWLELLNLDLQMGEFRWLHADGEEALTYYPNQKEILYFYGIGSAMVDAWDEAEYAVYKAKKLLAGEEEFARNLDLLAAYVEWGQNQNKEALVKEIENQKKAALGQVFEAHYLKAEGNLNGAIKALEKASDLSGTHFPQMVAFLVQSNELDKARNYLKEANPTPTLYEAWGDLLLKEGKTTEAEEKWRKAIEMGATDISIRKKLNQ